MKNLYARTSRGDVLILTRCGHREFEQAGQWKITGQPVRETQYLLSELEGAGFATFSLVDTGVGAGGTRPEIRRQTADGGMTYYRANHHGGLDIDIMLTSPISDSAAFSARRTSGVNRSLQRTRTSSAAAIWCSNRRGVRQSAERHRRDSKRKLLSLRFGRGTISSLTARCCLTTRNEPFKNWRTFGVTLSSPATDS